MFFFINVRLEQYNIQLFLSISPGEKNIEKPIKNHLETTAKSLFVGKYLKFVGKLNGAEY